MTDHEHATIEELEACLETILESPREEGRIEMIVRRPRSGERETLEHAELDLDGGLIGDNWKSRGSRGTPDGSAHPEMQLNIMNSRVIAAIAPDRSRRQLAGDQLYVDLDLSADNLPPGTRLELGTALIEVTAQPHLGCKKFHTRFGLDALKFVNAKERRALRLRGINAKIVRSGVVRVGDVIRKRAPSATRAGDGVDLDQRTER